MTGLKLPVSVCDMFFVFLPGVSVLIGDVGTSGDLETLLFALKEDEMSAVEAEDVGISDDVEGTWLSLEGDGVLAVPEVAVSWEMWSVGVCPLRGEEGVDVIPCETVPD